MKNIIQFLEKTIQFFKKTLNSINRILDIGYVRKIIIIVFSGIFLYSSLQIGIWFYENYLTKKTNEAISNIVKSNENNIDSLFDEDVSPVENKPVEKNKIKFLTTDISELKKINSDTVGWIKMLNCNVDYPVVKTFNNDYYINHDFYKNVTRAGWIFGDYRCNFNDFALNTIIYGHARYDGSMFGSLENTLKQSWNNKSKNHFIWLNTENQKTVWQIFSIYEIDPNLFYYIKTDFSSQQDYDGFLQEIKSKNQIPAINYEVTTKDKILTLSTCKGSSNRLVVHAKLIKIDNEDVSTANFSSEIPTSAEATPETTLEATPGPTSEATPEPTSEATPEPTSEATPEPTSEATPEPTPEATPTPEPT